MYTFIQHTKEDEEGLSFYIMEQEGRAFARAYIYKTEKSTIYLDMLSVSPEIRQQGVGTQLQEMREQIGLDNGAYAAKLFVDKDSWMYQWYKRRGYFSIGVRSDYPNYVWMIKKLRQYEDQNVITLPHQPDYELTFAYICTSPYGFEHLFVNAIPRKIDSGDWTIEPSHPL